MKINSNNGDMLRQIGYRKQQSASYYRADGMADYWKKKRAHRPKRCEGITQKKKSVELLERRRVTAPFENSHEFADTLVDGGYAGRFPAEFIITEFVTRYPRPDLGPHPCRISFCPSKTRG